MQSLTLTIVEAAFIPLYVATFVSDDLVSPKAVLRPKMLQCEAELRSIYGFLFGNGKAPDDMRDIEDSIVRMVAQFKWDSLLSAAANAMSRHVAPDSLRERVYKASERILNTDRKCGLYSNEERVLGILKSTLGDHPALKGS